MSNNILGEFTSLGVAPGGKLQRLLQTEALPIEIEGDRLYTPLWDEAFVDLKAIIRDDAYAGLCSTPKWLFDSAKPAAFAVRTAGGGLILVSEGLGRMIGFCAFHAGIASVMAMSGASEADLTAFEDTFLHIITNHVEHEWPLPDDIELKTEATYRQVIVNRDCMIAFVLLHELGHIRLGHLDAAPVGPIDFQPRVADLPSALHDAEIAADDFAFRAFTNADALNVATTLLTAWAYSEASRRLTRGSSAHLSPTHPLSVNRLSHLVQRLLEVAPQTPASIAGINQLVERTARLVESPEASGIKVMAISYDDGFARHRELIEQHRLGAARFA